MEAARLLSPRQFIGDAGSYIELFREADAVLVSGGTPIYDYGHVSRLIHMGLPVLNRKPLYLFGVGAKPLTSRVGRNTVRMLLRHAARVSVRDTPSMRLLNGLGAESELTGDSAHALQAQGSVERDMNLILICPRFLSLSHRASYHEPLSAGQIESVRGALAGAADTLQRRGYTVKFLPFHTVEPDNDQNEITAVLQRMKGDAPVLERPGSPQEAVSTLGKAGLVVGLRLHSLVLAAQSGTLVASIGYDSKVGGFMEMIKQERSLGSLENGAEGLLRRIEHTLGDWENAQKVISDRVASMKRLIGLEAAQVAKSIRLKAGS